VTITNDGATILSKLDIQHPAAKVLVDLAQLQDQEVGDGTTSVVIVAAELLKRGNELVKSNIHPTVWKNNDHPKYHCKKIHDNMLRVL
jgi:T-complex protein 1 subunit alpha